MEFKDFCEEFVEDKDGFEKFLLSRKDNLCSRSTGNWCFLLKMFEDRA